MSKTFRLSIDFPYENDGEGIPIVEAIMHAAEPLGAVGYHVIDLAPARRNDNPQDGTYVCLNDLFYGPLSENDPFECAVGLLAALTPDGWVPECSLMRFENGIPVTVQDNFPKDPKAIAKMLGADALRGSYKR
jgi:hypothetical protein